jgi:hypothetical protein
MYGTQQNYGESRENRIKERVNGVYMLFRIFLLYHLMSTCILLLLLYIMQFVNESEGGKFIHTDVSKKRNGNSMTILLFSFHSHQNFFFHFHFVLLNTWSTKTHNQNRWKLLYCKRKTKRKAIRNVSYTSKPWHTIFINNWMRCVVQHMCIKFEFSISLSESVNTLVGRAWWCLFYSMICYLLKIANDIEIKKDQVRATEQWQSLEPSSHNRI